MTLKGIIHGNVIELDESVPLPDGTGVEVTVSALDVRRGSPFAILALAGTLTADEANAIRAAARSDRH
ncbi:MAG: hypothetical protein K1X53_04035 [Candidatus Sumerlaeaceae bacterium]|nr:hypothetical protein [Candidatus Sumerlaeaceae bacterium]